jgi:hypothetical protein
MLRWWIRSQSPEWLREYLSAAGMSAPSATLRSLAKERHASGVKA